MTHRLSGTIAWPVALALLGILTGIAQAQSAPWQSEKGYANGIPIGTKITQANWQRYQQFMTEGMKTVFAGTHFWHMPRDIEIDVGPTRSIPVPRPYMEDTEKYGGQVTLQTLPDGGYAPKGYVAGFPFLDPFESDAALVGERVFWNTFYRPSARVEEAPNCSYVLDPYGNYTHSVDFDAVLSRLMHLSEPGFPRDEANAGGYWFAGYTEVSAPEQFKYFATLTLSPNDPTQLDEAYIYYPALRRSLRVSSSARCAPIYGTDFTIEDALEGPPRQGQLFKKEFLGTKKILTLLHAASESYTCNTSIQLDSRYYYPGSKGVAPFPNPGSGQWEVRDVYVVSLTRLPQSSAGFGCYGKRVLYLDRQNYFPASTDLWDTAGNLYKWLFVLERPAFIPGLGLDGQLLTISGNNTAYVVDFQDKHITIVVGLHVCVDGECAKTYLNISRYASPEGLMKIQQ